jgi:NAD(P)-dependent dehydrogenase (short-subunit alcohol dehydrogenase family)
MANAAASHMRQRGWGRIIGVTTSLDTMLAAMPYGPSKAAHEAFVAVLAKELEGTGVTANVVVPGAAVDTHMTRGMGFDTTAMLQPEVMQAPVVWLASDQSDGFNGRRIIARQWDESLPIDKRLEACSAPAAWPQLGPPPERRGTP